MLVLAGALTKSAMLPGHFWLPAAMEAPTPVSAYLHAAAMVKAGIYLVARLAPGVADVPGWRPVVIGFGVATMLVGGYRALRQNDLKLLLAFGTVSQLGFLMVLVGAGSRELAAAAWRWWSRTAPSSPPCSSPSGCWTTPPAPGTCGSCPGWAAGCPRSPSSAGSRAPRWPGCPAARVRRQGGRLHRPRRRRAADRPPLRPPVGLVLGWVLTAATPLGSSGAPSPASPAWSRPRPPSWCTRPARSSSPRPRCWPRWPCWLGRQPAAGAAGRRYAETLPLIAPEVEELALWHGSIRRWGCPRSPARRRRAVRLRSPVHPPSAGRVAGSADAA